MRVSNAGEAPYALHYLSHQRLVFRLSSQVFRLSFQVFRLHPLEPVEFLIVPLLSVRNQFNGLRECLVPLFKFLQCDW